METMTEPVTEKLLLLVDLNGTLCCRIFNNDQKQYAYYVRPNAAEFLKNMSKYFVVGILTCMISKNAYSMCKAIDSNFEKYIVKVYDEPFNKKDLESPKEWAKIRDMTKITKDTKRTLKTIVLIDDNERKFVEAPYNGIMVPTYGETEVGNGQKDNILNEVGKHLLEMYETWNTAKETFDVRDYDMKNCPFKKVVRTKTELKEVAEKLTRLELNEKLDL